MGKFSWEKFMMYAAKREYKEMKKKEKQAKKEEKKRLRKECKEGKTNV
jgi:hypothetical protein|nr:MAG TPA: hypothetical protein [Caudoviricetes sp.]